MDYGRKQPFLTCLFCPILWARAWACRSFWGFQSESKITTVSADARLIPRPPARVDNKKQKSWTHMEVVSVLIHSDKSTESMHCIQGEELTSDPSALKWSNACFLISPLMEPSNRYTNIQIQLAGRIFRESSCVTLLGLQPEQSYFPSDPLL